MTTAIRPGKQIVREFLEKPEVVLGLKITAIALAAIALTVGFTLLAVVSLPMNSILFAVVLRVTPMLIALGAIGLGEIAVDQYNAEKKFQRHFNF